jgi:hypothetical protein
MFLATRTNAASGCSISSSGSGCSIPGTDDSIFVFSGSPPFAGSLTAFVLVRTVPGSGYRSSPKCSVSRHIVMVFSILVFPAAQFLICCGTCVPGKRDGEDAEGGGRGWK